MLEFAILQNNLIFFLIWHHFKNFAEIFKELMTTTLKIRWKVRVRVCVRVYMSTHAFMSFWRV